jgi:hypothetical protein
MSFVLDGEITVALVGGSEFDRQRLLEVGGRLQAAGVLILIKLGNDKFPGGFRE